MSDAPHHPDEAVARVRLAASPVVPSAYRTLVRFGGNRLTRHQARTLLALWEHERTLTASEAAAILARFPVGEDEPRWADLPPVNAAGW